MLMPIVTTSSLRLPIVNRWQIIKGPLVCVGAIIAVQVLNQTVLPITTPTLIYLLCIAYAAFSGGISSGMISVVITLLVTLYFAATPGEPFSYTDAQLTRLVVIGVTSTAMAILVGTLKQRADHAAEERLHRQELQLSLQAERRYGAELKQANQLKEDSIVREQVARTEAEMAQRRLSALAHARDRALAEAELLNAIARAASGEDDLGRILSAALARLAQVIRFSGGSIALVEGDDLVLHAAVGPFTGTAIGQRMPRGPKRSWQIVEQGEPYLCNDLLAARVQVYGSGIGSTLRAYLAVPLIWRGRSFGLLEVDSTEPNVFNDGDLALMQAVAAVLSGPIELARRYAGQVQARQHVEQLAAERTAILGQLVDGVIIADPAGHITFINEAALRLHGADNPQDLAARDGLNSQALTLDGQLYPPDELPLARAVLHDETVVAAEWRIRRPDASEIIAQGSATPVVAEGGRRLGAVLVLRDITTQRLLEHQKDDLLAARDQALREVEAAQWRLAFLAEASTILVASLDYAATLTSVTRLAVPHLADWCIVHMRDDDGVIRQFATAHVDVSKAELVQELDRRYPIAPDAEYGYPKVMRTGQPELIAQCADPDFEHSAQDAEHLGLLRELGWREHMCVPLSANGQTLGAITLVVAESGRHYEPDDLILAGELAQRAALAVENARLYRAAQEAVHARDQFLLIASHELKTPLTSMLGYTQLVQRRTNREGTLPERDRRALGVIIGQVERLNKLVITMLDLSRIETGQLSIERGHVHLSKLVQRVVAEVQPVLEQHTVTVSVPDESLIVEGDELRLEQVVQNLVANAIKYSPASGPVYVQVERRDAFACVSVTDQGIGIPQESLPQLFQRFYRARNVDAEHVGGLGLGLYVVKEIVTLHGGWVDVASREGVGSTFTIGLPLRGLAEQERLVSEQPHDNREE
jgi:PAS domain S-box-containing protein